MNLLRSLWIAAGVFAQLTLLASRCEASTLLNASYDPTREFYQDVNAAFIKDWAAKTGQKLQIQQSHGGSGKQARAVIDGLPADVVTLALAYDIDAIAARGGAIAGDWQKRLPHNSCPYTSTIVFLVRKGNPKGIKDWGDLAKTGVSVITPNPRTSGGARWNYLAAFGYALRKEQDEKKAAEFVSKIFNNVPVFDSGARGATTTFVQRGIGDVLITWENEALLSQREGGADKGLLIFPSVSILAEPPVTWVDRVVRIRKSEDLAKAYLDFLYTPTGQELAAKHFFRPQSQAILKKYSATFPKVETFTIDEVFGGWGKAHQAHFAEGGTFDKMQAALREK